MKLAIEDKILLQFDNKQKCLLSHEININSLDKEIAIANLINLGYVKASENSSSMYNKYIAITLTTKGAERQRDLLRLINRSMFARCCDTIKNYCHRFSPFFRRIIEGVIISLLSGIIGFWLGRITT